MKWFDDLKIKSKLYLVFGVLITLLIALSILSGYNMYNVDWKYSDLISSTIAQQKNVSDAITEMDKINLVNITKGYQITVDASPDAMAALHESYDKHAVLFLEKLDEYRNNLDSDIYLSEEQKHERIGSVDEIESLFNTEYQPKTRALNNALMDGDKLEAYLYIGEASAIGEQITVSLDGQYYMAAASVSDISVETTRNAHISIVFLVVFGVFLIVFSIVVSVLMTHVINNPIIRTKNAMLEISKGNLNYPIHSDPGV